MYLICSHYITNKMACNRILFIFPQQDTFHMSTTGYFSYFHHRILFIFPQQDTLLSVQSCSITSIQSGTSPSIVQQNEAGEQKQGSRGVHPSKTLYISKLLAPAHPKQYISKLLANSPMQGGQTNTETAMLSKGGPSFPSKTMYIYQKSYVRLLGYNIVFSERRQKFKTEGKVQYCFFL